ncbi:MAG: hypothetical protein AAGF73_03025 [Actinomycetota bacterium]
MSPVAAVGLATALAAGTTVAANTASAEPTASTASTMPTVTPICTEHYPIGEESDRYLLCEVTSTGVVELPSGGSGALYVHAAGQPGATSKGGGGGRAQTLIDLDASDDLYVYLTSGGRGEDPYAGGSSTVVTTAPIEVSTIDDVIVIAGGGGARGRKIEWTEYVFNRPVYKWCGEGNGGAGGFVDAEQENAGASGPGTSPATASGGYSTNGSTCPDDEPIGHQPMPGNAGIGGRQTAGGDRDGYDGIGGPGGSRDGGIQPWTDADGNPVAAESCNCPVPKGYIAGAGGAWNGHNSAGGGGGNGGGGGGDKTWGGAGGGSYAAAPTGEFDLRDPNPRYVLDLPGWKDPNTDHASVWFYYEA